MRNPISATFAGFTLATLAFSAPAWAGNDVTITAKNFEFSPKVVTLKKGVPTTLHLKATEGAHGMAVPGIGLKNVILTSAEQTVVVTPTKDGTFPMHCQLVCGAGHANMAMTFIVK